MAGRSKWLSPRALRRWIEAVNSCWSAELSWPVMSIGIRTLCMT